MKTSSSTSRTGCCGGSSAPMRAGNSGAAGKGGCSCGGHGSCGCGGSCGCSACQGQEFVRPRFFAGQLLTEDDLALLEGYVVEKNRLHNRSVFGDGVVCGLMVTCDPCGEGKITVQPGYALDCCGNDIVVHCPQTLDVNAMVRQLRIEHAGGVDCGDPCSDLQAGMQPVPPPQTVPGQPPSAPPAGGPPASGDDETPTRPPLAPGQYCLYVRYCEQNTDPVSPYATDDPCGAQACEATRVREGFTFELRCRTCDEHAPDNLFRHIASCIGSILTNEQTSRHTRSMYLYSSSLSPALARLAVPRPAQSVIDEERLKSTTEARLRAARLPDNPETWVAVDVYEAADSAQTMASFVAAWNSIPAADRDAVENRETIESEVSSAQESLARIARVLPQSRMTTLIDDTFERTLVSSTVDRAALWANPDAALKTVPAGEVELLSGGVVYSKQMQTSLASALTRAKAHLLDQLRKRQFVTDCLLLRDTNAIVIPDDDPTFSTNRAGAQQARTAIDQFVDVYGRYLRECVCAAINPPCPPCDDPAVLLACLRVEGCDVRDICNLERTFVLTPVAFRYWMPFLRSLGEILERICCPDNPCDPPRRSRRELTLSTAADEGAVRPRLANRVQFNRAYVEQRSALRFTNTFVGPGRIVDPEQVAAVLPARIDFSPDSAQRLASSVASLLDVASLRRGVPIGDLVSRVFRRPVRVPSTGPLPVPPPPAPVEPPPAVDLSAVHRDIDDLKAKLTAAEDRNRKLDARLRKLEG